MRLRILIVSLLACGCSGAPSQVAEPPVIVTLPAAAGTASAVSSAAPAEEPGPVEMVQLGALGGTSSFSDNDAVPTGLLDQVGAVDTTAAARPVAPTRPPQSSSGSGRTGLSDGPSTPLGPPGRAEKVKGPVGQATTGALVVQGSMSNTSSVIAAMSAGFRRCFNKGLQEDPKMKGSVVIRAVIGANGEVLSATPTARGGLSNTVIYCVAARVSAAQFAPPDGGSAKVTIPLQFDSF